MSQLERRGKFIVATLAGTGFFPKAPGTVGSLVSLIMAYSLFHWLYPGNFPPEESNTLLRLPELSQTVYVLILVIMSSLGVLWSAEACEQRWGKDPAPVVLDETAGQLLILAAVPLSGNLSEDWIVLGAAFLAFRFFDILKPFKIRSLQQFNGGFGILIDDLAAAIYAIPVVYLVTLFI